MSDPQTCFPGKPEVDPLRGYVSVRHISIVTPCLLLQGWKPVVPVTDAGHRQVNLTKDPKTIIFDATRKNQASGIQILR